MSWTAAEFLDLIEHRGIMAGDHVDHLREQLAAAGCEIHAVFVARKLVEAGYLNPYFAKTLLEEGYQRRRTAGGSTQPRQAGVCRTDSPDEELDLAPLEEDLREEQAALAALVAGPPVELRIDLPPIQDPDAWPSTSDAPPLPAANSRIGFGALARSTADAQGTHRRPSDLSWLNWALGGAVVFLLLIVIVLLIWR